MTSSNPSNGGSKPPLSRRERVVGRDLAGAWRMKAPGTDKSRVVRLPKKPRFVVRSFAFFFFLSHSLSLSFLFVRLVSITNRHGDPCRGTNRRIGELLRKEVGYTPRSDNEEPRL